MNVLSKIGRRTSGNEETIEFPLPEENQDQVLPIEMESDQQVSNGPEKEKNQSRDNSLERRRMTPVHDEIVEASQHDLGNILLEVASRINGLEEKLKFKNPRIDIPDLCRKVNNTRLDDKEEQEQRIEETVRTVQERLVSSKLNFHALDHRVSPPTEFGTQPSLHKPEQLRMAVMLFPKHKYDNYAKSGGIIEHLDRMTAAQEKLNLTEQEFAQMMLMCCTGTCHEQLKLFLDNNESIASIYFRLLTIFDKSLSLDEARDQLHSLKATKNDSLASIEGKILKLSAILGRQWKAGIMRQNFCDLTNCSALIYSMPDRGTQSVRRQVHQLFNQLACELNRQPTFAELMAYLGPYSSQIDNGIKDFGDNNKTNFKAFNNYKKNNFARVNNIQLRKDKSFHNSSNFQAPGTTYRKDKVPGNNMNKFSTERSNSGNMQRTSRYNAKRTCSLCGDVSGSHSAAMGCFRMRNKQGQVTMVAPVQERCSICYDKTGQELFHPKAYCFRKEENSFGRRPVIKPQSKRNN